MTMARPRILASGVCRGRETGGVLYHQCTFYACLEYVHENRK